MSDAEMNDLAYQFYRLLEMPDHREKTLEKLRAASSQFQGVVLDLATKNALEAKKEYQASAATLHSVIIIAERRKDLAEDEHVRKAAEVSEKDFSWTLKKWMAATDIYKEVAHIYFSGLKLPE
jgi:hypothetical protein